MATSSPIKVYARCNCRAVGPASWAQGCGRKATSCSSQPSTFTPQPGIINSMWLLREQIAHCAFSCSHLGRDPRVLRWDQGGSPTGSTTRGTTGSADLQASWLETTGWLSEEDMVSFPKQSVTFCMILLYICRVYIYIYIYFCFIFRVRYVHIYIYIYMVF